MADALEQAPLEQRKYVGYYDLSGGLNTKKDAHALTRNQLAVSQNCWYATGNALSKRPGSIPLNAGQSTGSGVAGKAIATCRFSNQSVVLVQQGTALYFAQTIDDSWTAMSTAFGANPQPMSVAQMYDYQGTAGTKLFIVNGVDTPWTWTGPGSTTLTAVITTGTNCPFNHTNSAPITPTIVNTAGFYLFYSGEPTEPTGVYVSNPYMPQTFNLSSTTASSILPNPYIPYLVGWNDGINGGNVVALERLGQAMIVYKEQAIYRMDQVGLFGQYEWAVSIVSTSVGCTARRSVVSFDTFHVFLGVDGLYLTDGVMTQRISDNVPSFFDSTQNGKEALIASRTDAVAARHGQRYLLFYDTGGV